MLVTLEWLKEHADDPDTIILDTRPKTAYTYGHIANSQSISIEQVIKTDKYGSNLVIDGPAASGLFGSFGIDETKTVLLCGESMDPSLARIAWTLLYHGHDKTKILEPAVSALPGLGVTLVRKSFAPKPAKFESRANPALRASADQIKDGPDSYTILDARSPQEFVRGHIPNAILVPFTNGLDSRGNIFAPRESLEKNFEEVQRDRPIVCYCMYGHRGANLFCQLKVAGFEDVRLYDGSFIEWTGRRLPLG